MKSLNYWISIVIISFGMFANGHSALAAGKTLNVGLVDNTQDNFTSSSINYQAAVEAGGHKPVFIRLTDDMDSLRRAVEAVDVVLFIGGEDVNPARYGEQPSPFLGEVVERRDSFEYAVMDVAVSLRKPIVGICRGMQLINVYFGGTLYQDLPSELGDKVAHSRPDMKYDAVHMCYIHPGAWLHQVLGVTQIGVNSTHHQAVKRLGKGLSAMAWSEDGVIEALYGYDYPVFAVQFHPERLVKGHSEFLPIFQMDYLNCCLPASR